ncbi:hypothetical protein V2J92_06715 [Pseudomonas alliivorans]|nr:hypothetical protein [Pseudomonas alliivorans]
MIKRQPDAHDHIKHLADTLEVCGKARDAQGLYGVQQHVSAMKFYLVVEGYNSVVRVGQDLTDELVGIREYVGAKKVM